MKKRPLPPNTKLHSEKAKKVFSGVRFDTYQWKQKQFDGSEATYEVVKRDDTVIIIPVIDDQVVLVKEQQPHWDKPGLVLVAGMINKEEDIFVAARRELEEETGFIFKDFHLVYVESVAPGVEWTAYTFIANGYQGTKDKKLDAGEKNEVIKISVNELIKLTREKALLYRPRFIEDYLMQDKVAELKKALKSPEKYSKIWKN